MQILNVKMKGNLIKRCRFVMYTLLVALQKTPSLLGAECQGVGTTPPHANGRGQTVRFVAVIEPPVYWGISMEVWDMFIIILAIY